METLEATDRSQLRAAIKLLDKTIAQKDTHFAIRRNGDLDEYIEANEAGALMFSKELLRAVLEKKNNYAVFGYDLSKDDTDVWITYIEFIKEKKSSRSERVKIRSRANLYENMLYGLGFGMSILLVIIGAFTVAKWLLT